MNSESTGSRTRKKSFWRWAVPGLVIVLVLAVWFASGREKQRDIASFDVRRGPLDISVLEGGSIRAVDSQEIKCEVRVGYQGIKILKIVEEGYEVTAEDIRTNKVLVELDSSDLKKQIVQQDIQYETAVASLTDAQQNYEIQLNQNLSDIKAAEQKVRFARMEFDKFLGDSVTVQLAQQLGIEQQIAADLTNMLAQTGIRTEDPIPASKAAGETAVVSAPAPVTIGEPVTTVGSSSGAAAPAMLVIDTARPAMTPATTATNAPLPGPSADASADPATIVAQNSALIDFSEFASIEALGDGEAKQKLRKFEDELQVAKKEHAQAQAKLAGSKRLLEKGFVTRIELEQEEIIAENARLKVQTAETAGELFLKYDFSKAAEEALSKYAEAARELSRARKAAISKLAQAQAKLKSAQGQHDIQSRQRKELSEQLDACVIKATKPGLVVYGRGGDDMFYYGGEERIREGATVRERQSIITIPDMSKMSVRVKVHESYIRKVKKGQKARITVDAFADKLIDGEVTSVGVLPDSQNMWMNPDMKVYLTTITLSGTNDWLKPGMNAKVEIMVNRLEDVTYVPIQAVSPYQGKQVCYVVGGGKPDRRTVETGEFNDEFIEVKTGLKEGEKVLLRPAESPPEAGKPKEPGAEPEKKTAPTANPSPATVAAKT
jgi:multidrug resistance efflux pump